MGKELIINTGKHETRVALIEDGNFVEFYIERRADSSIVGNIYKGRVKSVLPGMQAAFVDIGLERTAFLYVADVQYDNKIYDMLMGASEKEIDDKKEESVKEIIPIEELLVESQELLVQVTKEPIGTKGARVSAHISLPGRYLVYMPGSDHVGISRRIEDEAERERLKKIVLESMPPGGGFIIRTASAGVNGKDLLADMQCLHKMWENVKEKGEKASPPSLVHQDLDITVRTIRDILSPDIEKIIIDSPSEYEKILAFMENLDLKMENRVRLYVEDEPILDHFGIEMQIDDMLNEKVWLKSGGYIVIETTEALTAIDVNTGRFTGKKNLGETLLKTNVEAAREIAYQLRLRNIGGIIIIDFIDMESQEDKDKVYNTLQEALKKDRAITRITEISELGLLEMTRKRIRNSIAKVVCKPCDRCEGRGYIKSNESIALEISRNITKKAASSLLDIIEIDVSPEISEILLGDYSIDITEIEKKYHLKIHVKTDPSLHSEDYQIN